MTADPFISWAFLLVSLVGVTAQGWALRRLWHASRVGLTRTAVCRVGCAVLYVMVGVNAAGIRWLVPDVSLAVFAVTVSVWIVNGWLDVRLERHGFSRPARHPGRCPATDRHGGLTILEVMP